MARRIAHDLKNPLTPMQMAARTAATSSDPGAAQAGEVLLEEIARLDELSRSFAQFGRPPEGPPSAVDLSELLVHLVRRIDPDGSALELRVPSGVALVEGHPVALERVIRNLVANAMDATAAVEGTEAIAGRRPTTGRDRVRVELVADGVASPAQVHVLVLDRGPGLPTEGDERIWDPEFTTKRRGTGLGLPLVRQVVEAHGGLVRAWNRPGGGAAFEVSLPLLPGGIEVPS
jgi:signal transduction histidine kinase